MKLSRRIFMLCAATGLQLAFLECATAQICTERLPGGSVAVAAGADDNDCPKSQETHTSDPPCVLGDLAIERRHFFRITTRRIEVKNNKVVVLYTFQNASGKIQNVDLKFHLPHVSAEYRSAPSERYLPEYENLSATVDGKQRAFETHAVPVLNGKDQTKVFRDLGYSTSEIENFLDFHQNPKSASALVDPEHRERLLARGLLEVDGGNIAFGWPAWHLEPYVVWREEFKRGQTKSVRIELTQPQCLSELSSVFFRSRQDGKAEFLQRALLPAIRNHCLDIYSFRKLRSEFENMILRPDAPAVFAVGERQFAYRVDQLGYKSDTTQLRFNFNKSENDQAVFGCNPAGQSTQDSRHYSFVLRKLKGKGTLHFVSKTIPGKIPESVAKMLQEETK